MTLFQPAEWRPNKLHAQGQWAMNLVGDGPVLTLSPIPVLEGHAAIYPEFATGPFAWRGALGRAGATCGSPPGGAGGSRRVSGKHAPGRGAGGAGQ
ncbi:MAG: hypothetical protein R2854_01275 [Caldilineaceae bacterium]